MGIRAMPQRIRNPFDSKQRKVVPIQLLVLGCTVIIMIAYVTAFYLMLGSNDNAHENASAAQPNDHLGGVQTMKEVQAAPVQPKQVVHTPTGVTIGFAVTVTGCGSDPITEGAAVLKHAIHLASVHGNLGGRYDYKMYAIYHPDGASCAAPLKDLGYEMVRRETPVAVKDIQGDFLRENIEKNGCCGEKELVKLEAYTLIEHPVVVHLDLDVLILKPMDALFDWMLVDPEDLKSVYDTFDVPIMWPEMEKPQKVNAFFTRDCEFWVYCS
jgi:hypothetical protein